MYRLYYYPGNANLAPHVLLEEAGAPYELTLVDRETRGQKDAAYIRLNPNGRIPTLVDGELVLFEAAAICMHIADRHPEAGLSPAQGSSERSHFYKWLIFLTNTIQPDLMAFFYPETYTADSSGIAAVRDQAERRLASGFAVLDGALYDGPYLVGGRYSACDTYLFMLCTWARHLSTPPAEIPISAAPSTPPPCGQRWNGPIPLKVSIRASTRCPSRSAKAKRAPSNIDSRLHYGRCDGRRDRCDDHRG